MKHAGVILGSKNFTFQERFNIHLAINFPRGDKIHLSGGIECTIFYIGQALSISIQGIEYKYIYLKY